MRLIYLSPVPWNSFAQRPHELIRYFHARTGGKVLWVDPYPTRFPVLSDLARRHLKTAVDYGRLPEWLTLVTPKALPIEPLPFSGKINQLIWRGVISQIDRFIDTSTLLGIGKPSELALSLLMTRCFASSFYDAMDDFPAFYRGLSRVAMTSREHKVVRKVHTVLTSSSSLHARFKSLAGDVRLVLNACASERMPTVPASRSSENGGAPVIGYVGTIAQWFDWEIVLVLAKAHPHATFRLIGPVYEPPPSDLPSNIVLMNPLPHSQALQAMTQFDIGLIPFKRTPLTSSVDPIKYYEYRALGLPVVSSAFGEMALRGERDNVWLIGRDSSPTAVIERALSSRVTVAAITDFRKNNSWEVRFNRSWIFPSKTK